jgi:hypothetical protein
MDTNAGSTGRDRDSAGRARNARPRDALGRPLGREAAGQAVMPDQVDVTPAWALATAQQLLDDDRPFHAHEVLEAAWKTAEPAERDLWQGLAQLAVGITHALRGNGRGAAALLRRGAFRLRGYSGGRDSGSADSGGGPHGIDTAGLIIAAEALADRIDASGLTGLQPSDLRLRLLA